MVYVIANTRWELNELLFIWHETVTMPDNSFSVVRLYQQEIEIWELNKLTS